MLHINHISHLDQIVEGPLKLHVSARFNGLSKGSDLNPSIVLAQSGDNLLSDPGYSHFGESGVYTNLLQTNELTDKNFISVFEWIAYLPTAGAYEMLYIEGDLGFWLVVPKDVVNEHPRLKAMIESQELSDPQPFF